MLNEDLNNADLIAENNRLKDKIRKMKQDKNKPACGSDVIIDGIKYLKADRTREYKDFNDFYTLEKKIEITFKTSLGNNSTREEQKAFFEWFFNNQDVKNFFEESNLKFTDLYLRGQHYYFTVSCLASVLNREFPTL